jgi:hypothetical protein
VHDPARRAALAAAAFGRSGLQMGQFLGQGSAAIAATRARYLELAGSQEKFAAGASDLDNTMRETETAFLGLRNAAAAELFPALTDLARAITGLITDNRGQIATWARDAATAISDWVNGGGIERLIATMREWAGIVRDVWGAIGGLKGILVAVGAVLGASFVASVATAAQAFYALGAAILTTPVGWFLAGVAAIAGAAYLVWKHWEPIKQFFVDLWDKIRDVATAANRWLGFGGNGSSPDPALGAGGGNGSTPAEGPTLGAAAAVPSLGASHARVAVDFSGMPKGTRVTTAPGNTADVDLSMGYSMWEMP